MKRHRLLIATRNRKKFKEIKRLFKGFRIKILSLDNFINIPEVIEDKKTFHGNAMKKALVVSRRVDCLVLADDSGLEVNSLGNAPGVHSARYAGRQKNDKKNCLKLLKALKDKPRSRRKAHFTCVVAMAKQGEAIKIVKGVCNGMIGLKMEGKTGFGYDPLFIPLGYKKSFALLGSKIKDRLSHRRKALNKARRFIEGYLPKTP